MYKKKELLCASSWVLILCVDSMLPIVIKDNQQNPSKTRKSVNQTTSLEKL